MEDSELYGKSTVSFSPSLSGSTPVFLPYIQLSLFLISDIYECLFILSLLSWH